MNGNFTYSVIVKDKQTNVEIKSEARCSVGFVLDADQWASMVVAVYLRDPHSLAEAKSVIDKIKCSLFYVENDKVN